jgi:uncharacterized membrane protein (DUF2068 family)
MDDQFGTHRLGGFGAQQAQRDGAIAIGYRVLEAVEGYGLLRRQQWGEYLTVVSTALLFIPEMGELLKHPTGLRWAACCSTRSSSCT